MVWLSALIEEGLSSGGSILLTANYAMGITIATKDSIPKEGVFVSNLLDLAWSVLFSFYLSRSSEFFLWFG